MNMMLVADEFTWRFASCSYINFPPRTVFVEQHLSMSLNKIFSSERREFEQNRIQHCSAQMPIIGAQYESHSVPLNNRQSNRVAITFVPEHCAFMRCCFTLKCPQVI